MELFNPFEISFNAQGKMIYQSEIMITNKQTNKKSDVPATILTKR